jgi:hypothetical protein
LSLLDVTTTFASGENIALVTQPLWPRSDDRNLHVDASQSFADPSLEDVVKREPSAVKWSELTLEECAVKDGRGERMLRSV